GIRDRNVTGVQTCALPIYTPGNDIRFSMDKVEASRNFANKLWNATRFVMMNLDEKVVKEDLSLDDLEEEDKWILSRMNTVIKEEIGRASCRERMKITRQE